MHIGYMIEVIFFFLIKMIQCLIILLKLVSKMPTQY